MRQSFRQIGVVLGRRHRQPQLRLKGDSVMGSPSSLQEQLLAEHAACIVKHGVAAGAGVVVVVAWVLKLLWLADVLVANVAPVSTHELFGACAVAFVIFVVFELLVVSGQTSEA